MSAPRIPSGCVAAPARPDPDCDARGWAEHVDACGPCRDAWVAEDPSRVFALLALEPIDDAVLDAVSADVAREVRSWPSGRGVRPWRRVAAIAAAVGLAGALFSLSRDRSLELAAGAALDGTRLEVAGAARGDEALATRASVFVRDSPGVADVVDVEMGDIQVVMIYDERLDL